MSSTPTQSLDKAKLQRLLSAIGSSPAAPPEQYDAVEYDWKCPHYFSIRQRAALANFVGDVASKAAVRLTSLCRADLRVKASSTTEHFTHDILNEAAKQETGSHYLIFAAADEQVCGFIDIPPQSAMAWAAQLLGDSDLSTGTDRELSELEESLLSDAAMALVRAFSDSFDDRDFQPITRITRDVPTLPFQDTDELCRIALEAKKANADNGSTANLVVLSRELLPVVGPGREISAAVTAEDTSRAIMGHLLQMSIVVKVVLDTAMITLQQAMHLESGDILLLNKKLNEPIRLLVDGQTIMYGWPAQSESRYAFVAAEGDHQQEA